DLLRLVALRRIPVLGRLARAQERLPRRLLRGFRLGACLLLHCRRIELRLLLRGLRVGLVLLRLGLRVALALLLRSLRVDLRLPRVGLRLGLRALGGGLGIGLRQLRLGALLLAARAARRLRRRLVEVVVPGARAPRQLVLLLQKAHRVTPPRFANRWAARAALPGR